MAIDTEEQSPAKNKGGKGGSKNNNKVIVIILAVVGALIVLSIIGTIAAGFFATKATETIFESATGGKVDIDTSGDGNVTFKDENGDTTILAGPTAEVPEDFPSIVPVYEGATVVSSSSFKSGEEGRTFSVVLTTNDSPKDVSDFYKQVFGSDGWEVTASHNMNDLYSIQGKHEVENLFVTASATKDDDQTTIVLGARTNFSEN